SKRVLGCVAATPASPHLAKSKGDAGVAYIRNRSTVRWKRPLCNMIGYPKLERNPMDLLTRLQEDMKTAMKTGQKERLSVIRMLLSDVKNIDLMPNKPTAEQVVASYAKKLQKGVEEYEKLGKPEEVAKFKSEIAIVEEYLPRKASTADTEK